MNTFNLSLDLDKTPDVPDWVTLRQGDKSGTAIVATIYDHGVQLVGTYNARVVIGNPDGEHYYRANATYNAGVATVTIDEQVAASVAGSTYGYFEILQGSTVIASTANFGVRILPSALDGAEPGEVYDTAIQDAIDGLNDAVNALPTTVEGILEDHPEWTTTVQDGSISVPKLASDVRSSLSGAILATIGGTLVTASDAAAAPPYASTIFGRSTQSGTPTPSSPVAITSVTAAELALRGRNLIPLSLATLKSVNTSGTWSGDVYTINGTTVTPLVDGGLVTGIKISGTPSASSAFTLVSGVAYPQGTYILSGTGATGNTMVHLYARIGSSYKREYNGAFTTEAATWNFIAIQIPTGHQGTVTVYPQMEFGTTASAFRPYDPNSSTLAIDLQGHELRSLPDGTRDELQVGADGHVTLVQRVGAVTFSGASAENWKYSSSSSYSDPSNGKYCYYADSNVTNIRKGTGLFVASLATHYALVSLTSFQTNKAQGTYTFSAQDTNPRFTVMTPHTTKADMTAWLASNNITVLYPLATEQTIDLGYVTLPTLPAPDLTAWAAQGAEFELTYQRDATLVIAGIYAQLAPVDGPTATSNHGVGTYLMLGGTLCKVTTAIAAGETIAIGTNVVATNVMTEILALTA